MVRTARLAIAAVALMVIGLTAGSAASPASIPTRQQIAQRILASKAFLTSSARSYVESVARNDHRLAPDSVGISVAGAKPSKASLSPRIAGAGLVNVRVNNPALDTHQTDQTTQSETSVAVSGANVAAGYNNSQHGLLFLTAGASITGYAYSTNGGATFTDGGALPNAPGDMNLGDPWLASDSSGAMYFSNLTLEGSTGSLLVGVSRSTNGGKTWSPAVPIPPPPQQCGGKGCGGPIFYSADKDALTTGPGTGNLYDAWDDFTFDPTTGSELSGLPVAHSTDGGQTWAITYASQVPIFGPTTGCSFSQYIGAQPLVANGIVYDAAELISSNDPNCTGAPVTFSEAVFMSNDGGMTWKAGAVVPITSSTPGVMGVFTLGPGMFMRNLEFPTLASFNGKVYMAWNDGGDGSGHSHIRVGQLNSFGQFSALVYITSGTNDEVQPAMSADTGLHIAYYQISTAADGTGMLDVLVSNQGAGGLTVQRVTSQSFPGVFTNPQFDPIIAFTYMGDYIANVSDGTHQYIVWGDNRDIVHNFLWPNGRHDPDVFFAKQ
jgi:hypothetical protein